jgi:hypothetical protein
VGSSHDPQRLNRDGGRNLGWRQNHDARNKWFEEASEMKARGTAAKQYGGAERDAVSDETLKTFKNAA